MGVQKTMKLAGGVPWGPGEGQGGGQEDKVEVQELRGDPPSCFEIPGSPGSPPANSQDSTAPLWTPWNSTQLVHLTIVSLDIGLPIIHPFQHRSNL